MADLLSAQHRLIYSLMKPVVRAAARFEVSIAFLDELMRLAYFEVLTHEHGLSIPEIAQRFGQSERNMRNLAKRMREDFFTPEREVGLVREVERFIAAKAVSASAVAKKFSSWPSEELEAALQQLQREERIVFEDSRYSTAKRYVVFRSDAFKNRIDALNHFLGGSYKAILQRLIFDNKDTAMIKTLSFAARRADLKAYVAKLEGELRRDLSDIEEQAHFAGQEDQQYTLSITLSPLSEAGHSDDE